MCREAPIEEGIANGNGRQRRERIVDLTMCLEWQLSVTEDVGCFVSSMRPFLIEQMRDLSGKEALSMQGFFPDDIPDADGSWTNQVLR